MRFTGRTSGTTLLELMITLAVGSVILGGIYSLLMVSHLVSAESLSISRVEQRARLPVMKIEMEMLEASVNSPNWSLADGEVATEVTFNRCIGSVDGIKIWSPPITYRYSGDQLLRTDAEGTITIGASISAVSFSRNLGILHVSVTAEENHRGRFQYTKTVTTDVVPRN